MVTDDEILAEAQRMADMTLQEIEQNDWGDPSTGETNMIARCLELRRTPLNQFDDEDVRLLVGQGISLPITVPLALGMLQVNPWLGGDMELGTLLACVVSVKTDYWRSHIDQETMLNTIVERQVAAVSEDPWLIARAPFEDDPAELDYALFTLIGLSASYWHARPTLEEQLSAAVDRFIAELDNDPWYAPPSEPGQEPPGALRALTDLPNSYLDNHLDQAARIVVLVDKALTTLEQNPWHNGPEWMVPGFGLATLMDLPGYPWGSHLDQKARLEAIEFRCRVQSTRPVPPPGGIVGAS